MSRRQAGERKVQNRGYGRHLAALTAGVLLCAAALVLTIAARIGITALSDETARLQEQIDVLRLETRNAWAEYARARSPESIARAAEELGMVPPGNAERVFVDAPREDRTILFPAYQTQADKQKTIWEYFG